MNKEGEKAFETDISLNNKKPFLENVIKHISTRIGIFITLLLLCYLLLNNLEGDAYGGGTYLILLVFGLCFLIFLLGMVVEIFVFQKQKKIKLRNANVIFIAVIIVFITMLNIIGKYS
jgi:uncharacterized membrane protein